jgi:hypothetical protein
MKSPFCQWLNDLSDLAEKDTVIIEAKYFDVLDFLFRTDTSIEKALKDYNDTVRRIKAIQSDFNNKPHIF